MDAHFGDELIGGAFDSFLQLNRARIERRGEFHCHDFMFLGHITNLERT